MRSRVVLALLGGLAGFALSWAVGVSAAPQAPSAAVAQKKALVGVVKPIGPYTPGVSVGNMVFLSGQLGLDPASGNMVEGGTAAEARRVMENLGALLKEAGLGYEHVVKTTIYMIDLKEFATVNEIYGSYFPPGATTPARSTVQVAALPRGGRVEIDFVAMR
jgi:2-iminobutanoate/2-iminopropanoate deaminase